MTSPLSVVEEMACDFMEMKRNGLNPDKQLFLSEIKNEKDKEEFLMLVNTDELLVILAPLISLEEGNDPNQTGN